MDKYYTVMIIPEKQKGIKSLRIPSLLYRSMTVTGVLLTILILILGYDYWKILQQVYENKHLSIENRQLKEQIQLFQMKMNSLTNDLVRINNFEKKLRVMTGLEDVLDKKPLFQPEGNIEPGTKIPMNDLNSSLTPKDFNFQDYEESQRFQDLKIAYDKKIAQFLGLEKSYMLTKQWSDLTRRSFALSYDYAKFDYIFESLKKNLNGLEESIHTLDEHLLDKQSILRSTPSLLPARGWVTSYYGQRVSPYSGQLKMHEGIDVGAPSGTPIVAPADGVITFSGEKAGFGKFVQVDHGYGIETIYAHNQSLNVKYGDKVSRGTLIAKVGNTGHSTGPHLHYEVRINGIAVDPLYYILE